MPAITSDLLCQRYTAFFAVPEPPVECRQFFAAFPVHRGIADPNLSPEWFRAVAFTALVEASEAEQVMLLVPAKWQTWAVQQWSQLADDLFSVCRQMTGDRKRLAEYYAGLFKRVYVFSRLLQLANQPPNWLSFGFTTSDPIPGWMQNCLLSV